MADNAVLGLDPRAAGLDADPELPELVIEPSKGWRAVNWSEIWRFRELLYFLTWRDVKIRYKQTVLGGAWALLQPFATMVVFSVFFGRLAGLENRTGGVPYPIYVYAGLLAWTFFANAITASSNSLVGSSNLISKVYFPRLIIPLAAVGAGLVDFLVSSLLLLAMMAYYQISPTAQLLWIPLFLLGTVLTATGVGMLLSALTVSYRDFRYVVPFMVQLWLFISPVIYPVTIVPEGWRWVLALNPMTGFIGGFRAAFLGRPIEWTHLLISAAIAIAVFLIGATYFRSVERRFADII
ncbi:MAG: ABC transporter permease [Actinomycetota bacterium]